MKRIQLGLKSFLGLANILTPLLLLAGVTAIFLLSARQAAQRAHAEAEQRIDNAATQQALLLHIRLDGQFETLEALAADIDDVLENDARTRSEDARQMLPLSKRYGALADVGLALPDGSVITREGTGQNIADQACFQRAMRGSRAMGALFDARISATARVALCVPIGRAPHIKGALFGTFDQRSLDGLTPVASEASGAWTLLLDDTGRVALQSGDGACPLDRVDVAGLANGEGEVLTPPQEAARSPYDGVRQAALDGETYYYKALPLDGNGADNGWSLLYLLNEAGLTRDWGGVRQSNLEMAAALALLFALATAFYIGRDYRANRAIRKDAEAIRRENDRFNVIYECTSISVWDYDFATREIRQKEHSRQQHGMEAIVSNVPQSLVDSGFVHPESSEAFLAMYERLFAGEERAEGVFRVRRADGTGYWYEHIRYKTLFDAKGKPYAAIGMSDDVTKRREQELAYAKWRQTFTNIPLNQYRLIEYNLTTDVCERVEGSLIAYDSPEEANIRFNERIERMIARYVHPDDISAIREVFLRENLLAHFYDGRNSWKTDFRIIDDNRTQRWARLSVQLVEYGESSDISAYLLCQDIDEQKREELELIARSESDPLTGVLNRNALIRRVAALLASSGANDVHALMMVDIDGFKSINDTFGHLRGDQLLIELCNCMRTLLRRDDLIGRIGGDEFIICMREVSYDAVAAKKARSLCDLARKRMSEGFPASLSMGVAMFPRDGVTFDELYRNADAAMYETKRRGKDGYTFCHGGYAPDGERAEAAQNADAADARAPTGTRPDRYLLVVDDSSEDRARLAGIFSARYTVLQADGGKAGLALLRQYGTRILGVLLDLNMPGMSGVEVLNHIRANEALQSVPVIAMSTQENEAETLEAIRAGALDYVCKGVDPALLRLRVQSVSVRVENEQLHANNAYLQLQSEDEARFRQVLDATGTVVFTFDTASDTWFYDGRAGAYLGGRYDGRALPQILCEDGVADASTVEEMKRLIERARAGNGAVDDALTARLKTAAGEMHYFKLRVILLTAADSLAPKLLLTFNDVNDETIARQELILRAERDPLTGLYNREMFIRRAGEDIAAAPPSTYDLMCVDVENFKVINDRYGRTEGDRLLRCIAEAIDADMRALGGYACRLFADTFIELFPHRQMQGMLDNMALSGRIRQYELPIRVTLRRGVYIVEDTALPVAGMIDRSILAQRSVRGSATTHRAYYNESMREAILTEQAIVDSMGVALEEEQFTLYVQPQYDHASKRCVGAEALVRWQHPAMGMIMPGIFIPIFERNGFIAKLDLYVLEHACEMVAGLLAHGVRPPPLSVNISRDTLCQTHFAALAGEMRARYHVPNDLIRLEITESAFADAEADNMLISVIRELRQLGFDIEIDDFGSGYSSLNTLKDVPADVLKMDVRFFEHSGDANRGHIIIESIVNMAQKLNMLVVAEGVETMEQADELARVGCQIIQGYLYARPMPSEAFKARILETDTL